MPLKRYTTPDAPTIHEWPGGFTWIAHPDEAMHRASHAIVVGADGTPTADGDRVWLVEPIDYAGLDADLHSYGTVAGVVVLAALHRRDAAAVASRHDVPVVLPSTVAALEPTIDAPVTVVDGLPDTSFTAIPVLDGVPWREAVLYDPVSRTLVATEILVTSDQATGWGERLSVGPYARLQPPRAQLGDLEVDRVLVGHGPPLETDATAALDRALARSVRGLPAYLLKDLWFMLRAGYVAMRD